MTTQTYVGSPCKYGHVGLRYKSSGGCIECLRARYSRPAPDKPAVVAVWRAGMTKTSHKASKAAKRTEYRVKLRGTVARGVCPLCHQRLPDLDPFG